MKINLYYVEGISRIDTPSFNTKTHVGTIEDQEEFFLTKLVKSIDISFYPPHYQNSIKFDKDDLEITDNINYLSLEYNGKTYYYFIDDIDYTSTGIITLEVSMDTIQTYMFDIYISSGIIERKFINRWDSNNKINRTYVRENVSDGLYEITYHYDIPLPSSNWFIVAKLVEADGFTVNSKCGIKDVDVIYPSHIMFTPYTYSKYLTINNVTYRTDTSLFMLRLSKNPKVCELYTIPFSPFSETDYNSSTGVLNPSTFEILNAGQEEGWCYGFSLIESPDEHGVINPRQRVNSDIKVHNCSFDYAKNYNKQVIYNSRYMPVMFDENYIHFVYGSRSSNTSVSLYKYNFTNLKCCYYANILDGSIYYYISSSDSVYKEDNYRTLVCDYSPIKLDLVSDAYAQFNITNKYRWLEAIGTTATRAALLFMSIYAKGAFAAKDISKIAATSLTPVRKKVSKKGQRAIEAIQRQQRDAIHGQVEDVLSSMVPVTKQGLQDSNMMYVPDNIKQSNSISDISSISYQIFYEIQKVNDYEQCAQYYHRNGYMVNEYVTQVSNIFNLVKNRYYFDMLKMSIAEVHLHHIIEDEATIGELKDRLELGLHLWNVKNSEVIMGDFTYDNVEYDYLS